MYLLNSSSSSGSPLRRMLPPNTASEGATAWISSRAFWSTTSAAIPLPIAAPQTPPAQALSPR